MILSSPKTFIFPWRSPATPPPPPPPEYYNSHTVFRFCIPSSMAFLFLFLWGRVKQHMFAVFLDVILIVARPTASFLKHPIPPFQKSACADKSISSPLFFTRQRGDRSWGVWFRDVCTEHLYSSREMFRFGRVVT